MRRYGSGGMTFTFVLLGLVILLFIAVPLFKMVFGADPVILWDTLLTPDVMESIWLTLYTALIATAVGCILGVPLAYILARYDFPGKKLLESTIDIPVVIPHSAAGIALLFVFGRNYLAGKAFGAIGIDFIDSVPGIVIAMLFVSIPFLIDSAKEGFRQVDTRLEKVSRSLGASSWQTFFRISFPLSWRSILNGNIMMWARGLSEFGAVMILAYHPMIAPVLVYERFTTHGLEYSQPVAVILIVISVIIFVILRMLAYRRSSDDKTG
jgi:molybdate/tungstate transport system permease protein